MCVDLLVVLIPVSCSTGVVWCKASAAKDSDFDVIHWDVLSLSSSPGSSVPPDARNHLHGVEHILKYLRDAKHVMICGIVCRISFILFGLWTFLAISDLLCFLVLLVLWIVFLVGQSIA